MSYEDLSEQEIENHVIEQICSSHNFIYRQDIKNIEALNKNFEDKLFELNTKLGNLSEADKNLPWFSKVVDKFKDKKAKEFDYTHDFIRGDINIELDDGSKRTIAFSSKNIEDNCFEVINQLSIYKKDHNYGRDVEDFFLNKRKGSKRYDVNILINGIPFVQIELKKNGIDIRNAFKQSTLYCTSIDHSPTECDLYLLRAISLLVISNTLETRYFTRGTSNFDFTFLDADVNNRKFSYLDEFVSHFLDKTYLLDMIFKYTIIGTKNLVILRPYQVYAVKAIMNKVNQYIGCEVSNNETIQNGYIWHTTGSGKTLTSFRASTLISTTFPNDIYKVVFVVDRVDLNRQTVTAFNEFENNSVDIVKNIHSLISLFTTESKSKLIVTTIQKLNLLVSLKEHDKLKFVQDKRYIFVFDECHRSQFGETHPKIKSFFPNHQLFGFTGTPIFEESAKEKLGRTLSTNLLFNECLHTYNILDGIRDNSVLGFNISYYNTITKKYEHMNKHDYADEQVTKIDKEEIFLNEQRIKGIVENIALNHDKYTANRKFNAILCVDSVKQLIAYYKAFKILNEDQEFKKEYFAKNGSEFKKLKIAAIFTATKQQYSEITGGKPEHLDNSGNESLDDTEACHVLNAIINDYTNEYGQKVNSFAGYFNSIHELTNTKSFRESNKNDKLCTSDDKSIIDILIVVRMFLTGYDAPRLNTLYVDQNMEKHNLIQAFSRTNRIFDDTKLHGNIVCYRNLKAKVKEALSLFASDNHTESDILDVTLALSYIDIKDKYLKLLESISSIVRDPEHFQDVYYTDEDKLAFINLFKELNKADMAIKQHIDFYNEDPNCFKVKDNFGINSYKSMYLALKRDIDKSKQDETKEASILDDVEFDIQYVCNDMVDVKFLLNLMNQYCLEKDKEKRSKVKFEIKTKIDELALSKKHTNHLYSKAELLEAFFEKQILTKQVDLSLSFEDNYLDFCKKEKDADLVALSKECNIETNLIETFIQNRIKIGTTITNIDIINDQILKPHINKLNFLQKKAIYNLLVEKINDLISKYY